MLLHGWKKKLARCVSRNRMVASTRTNVSLKLVLANARNILLVLRARGVDIPRRRRARLRPSALELEGRGLLSLVTPILSTALVPSDAKQPRVSDVSSVASRQDDRGTAQDASVISRPAERDRGAKGNEGDPADSTPVRRSDSDLVTAIRRSNSNNSSERELVDSQESAPHGALLDSRELADEAPLSGSEPISGSGAGDSGDPAAAPSIVGSALEAVMSAIVSATNSGALGALDSRSGSYAGASAANSLPPGTSSPEVPTSSGSGRATSTGARGTPSDPTSDPGSALVIGSASAEATVAAFSAANLLDAAIHADWEGVDGEFRQFLARLGNLADSPDGRGPQAAWPFWLGAATAVLVARRASYRGRRFSGCRERDNALAAGRCPSPAGPWPLGLP